MNAEPLTYRMLVVANETCPCPALLEEVAERAGRHDVHAVLIVAPALNSRLRHYLSDSDGAVAAARERLTIALEFLQGEGVAVRGDVGDADPFVAVSDALHDFAADEVMLSTHPPDRSHWLERDFVERVRAHIDVPVQHLVSAYGVAAA